METKILHIPLGKLSKSHLNVRRTESKIGIEALAENIARNGLLQSLAVVEIAGKPGHHAVTGGGRRLAALKLLAKQGRIARDADIPCILVEADEEEASLAENEVRQALHPADAFESYDRLHKKGLGAEDIAARFGVTAHVVRQRLRLAAVSPNCLRFTKRVR